MHEHWCERAVRSDAAAKQRVTRHGINGEHRPLGQCSRGGAHGGHIGTGPHTTGQPEGRDRQPFRNRVPLGRGSFGQSGEGGAIGFERCLQLRLNQLVTGGIGVAVEQRPIRRERGEWRARLNRPLHRADCRVVGLLLQNRRFGGLISSGDHRQPFRGLVFEGVEFEQRPGVGRNSQQRPLAGRFRRFGRAQRDPIGGLQGELPQRTVRGPKVLRVAILVDKICEGLEPGFPVGDRAIQRIPHPRPPHIDQRLFGHGGLGIIGGEAEETLDRLRELAPFQLLFRRVKPAIHMLATQHEPERSRDEGQGQHANAQADNQP